MSIGMSYDEFWHDDPQLAVFYRNADKFRRDRTNQELWLQGLYIYSALCDVAPVLHAFAKKGTKPNPYITEPIPLTKKDQEAQAEREKQKRIQRIKEKMFAGMQRAREAKKDVSND